MDTWSYACKSHLSNMCCKKQHCNYCNTKSLIKRNPMICSECANIIIENCIVMTEICKYPRISREECVLNKCSFCIKNIKV